MAENTRFTRREMIAAASAVPLAAGAARALAQEAQGQPLLGNPTLPEPPAERMGWAIVGLGTFAVGQVIPGFGDARHSRLAAFVSGNAEKARELGRRYGVERCEGRRPAAATLVRFGCGPVARRLGLPPH